MAKVKAKAKPKKRPKFEVGDTVSCRVKESGSYSGYGGNPEFFFCPGMCGVIVSISPKVRILPAALPKYDTRDEFINVRFFAVETNKMEKVGLHFSNTILISKSDGQ